MKYQGANLSLYGGGSKIDFLIKKFKIINLMILFSLIAQHSVLIEEGDLDQYISLLRLL